MGMAWPEAVSPIPGDDSIIICSSHATAGVMYDSGVNWISILQNYTAKTTQAQASQANFHLVNSTRPGLLRILDYMPYILRTPYRIRSASTKNKQTKYDTNLFFMLTPAWHSCLEKNPHAS